MASVWTDSGWKMGAAGPSCRDARLAGGFHGSALNVGGMAAEQLTPTGLDALPPPEMARKAEQVGVTKAGLDTATTFALSVLAGAFIAMGAVFATTATAGGEDHPTASYACSVV